MILTITAYIGAVITVIILSAGIFSERFKKQRLFSIISLLESTLLLSVLIYRSSIIEFPALTGTFESLIFYSLCIFTLNGIYGLQKKYRVFTVLQFFAVITALGLLLIASSPIVGKELHPPIPALQSGWLLIHVALSFIGESFFAFSFITAILSIVTKDDEKRIQYDKLTYSAVITGYPIFTLGALIFGAIWAEAAWGTFWSWDPKETWALITWLVYSVYLHFRLFRKSKIKLCSWIAVIGFLSTLFTFFGVNYLLSGLHSYG